MAKQKTTCVIYRNDREAHRISEDKEVFVNEHGQRYVIHDKLRYRLNSFDEWEMRYGHRQEDEQ